MTDPFWQPFDYGATLGQTGSEAGAILRDDEHALGARITLERGSRAAPFAITCGIYGWMLHTRFFASAEEAEAQYEAMKYALAALLEEAEENAETGGGHKALMQGVSQFVERFP